jgi:exosortase H (IPTLxxWG-CTERM-specific)
VVLFLVIGILGTLVIRIEWVDDHAVYPYTRFIAALSAGVFQLAAMDVQARDTMLLHPDFRVDIRRGCDGVVATLILVAACVAFPVAWARRLWGVLLGYLLIFVMNLIRIVVLMGLGIGGQMALFDFVHTYISQFIVIAAAVAFWLYWASAERTEA